MWFRNTQSQILKFIELHVDVGVKGRLDLKVLFEKYREWCQKEEIENTLGKHRFGVWLEECGLERYERSDKVRYYGSFRPDCPVYLPFAPLTSEEKKILRRVGRSEVLKRREEYQDRRPLSRYLKGLIK